jgi:aryl-alcohol dehydrogenase-like predicted oxidoreductase
MISRAASAREARASEQDTDTDVDEAGLQQAGQEQAERDQAGRDQAGRALLPSEAAASSLGDLDAVDGALTRPMPIVAPRRVGESDLTVYPVALGGSAFGWTADEATSHAVLDRFVALGGNLVDTADSYAGGRSELIIGHWMRERGNRDKMVVATKIGRNQDNPGLGSVAMVRAVEASLERLQTDRIDILTFHDDDPQVPLENSLATAEWLIETGKVRAIAATNFRAERLIEARILSATGLPKFVAIEPHYNLMHRDEFEGDLRIVAAAQGLGVLPHTALASGFLTGKYRGKVDLGSTVRGARAGEYLGRKGHRVLVIVERIAQELGCEPGSVALAWLLAKRMVVAPVASATSPEQVDGLMDAAAVRLTRAHMLELDKASE